MRSMQIQSYYAVFDPAVEGGFNVSFPDFAGCLTFGKTFEEAKEKAQEVLGLWIEELNAMKQEIPTHIKRPIIDEVEVQNA
jgi:predicted RNase H-like HicB family nuclease